MKGDSQDGNDEKPIWSYSKVELLEKAKCKRSPTSYPRITRGSEVSNVCFHSVAGRDLLLRLVTGFPIANNWLKMHGGVMGRNFKKSRMKHAL